METGKSSAPLLTEVRRNHVAKKFLEGDAMRRLAFLIFLVLFATAAAAGEHRWLSAGLSPVKADLKMPLAPGEEKEVSLTVVNLGDVPCEVEIKGEEPPKGVVQDGGRPAPPDWVKCSPEKVSLEPHRAEYVTVTLKPDRTASGEYVAAVAARAVLPEGSVKVSTVSYSTVRFSVSSSARPKRALVKYGPSVLVLTTLVAYAVWKAKNKKERASSQSPPTKVGGM